MNMSATGVHGGVQGIAVVRAADAMLRALGGDQIQFLFPSMAMPSDPAAQLGLVDAGVDEVNFQPVIVRDLPTDNNGPRRRVEFLVPASGIVQCMAERNFASAEQWLDAALGIVYGVEIFHIEGYVVEEFAGTAYLYRITAVD
jgi:hypothetical protein